MNIELRSVTRSYNPDGIAEVHALKGVSLSVAPGESLAIVGPSGAGKSSLLHILGLMDRPTTGSVFIDGKDVSLLADRDYVALRHHAVGFLFQFHYLLPDFTVGENVMLPVWDEKAAKWPLARHHLEHLGLSSRIDHMPTELSGGEQQRVALIRALIGEPKLLLADEPTGNLDRETGAAVEALMFDECRRRGITLVLVTHNLELAEQAERVVSMRDGLIVSETRPPRAS